jgi:hypothetical protein
VLLLVALFILKSFAENVFDFDTFKDDINSLDNKDINITTAVIVAADMEKVGRATKNITSNLVGGSVLYGAATYTRQ